MIYLHGMGHFFPDTVITNRFISELDIGSSEEWILDRVGIRTRRTTLSLDYIRRTKNRDPRAAEEASSHSLAEMGAAAARMALQRAGVPPSAIGMIVGGSSSPSHAIPALASAVGARLGIDAACVDINSACSSFLVQLSVLAGMQPDRTPPYVLVVDAERCTHVVDFSDRRVAPLFGDGASAALISLVETADKVFETIPFQSLPARWEAIQIPKIGHFVQDGRAVQRFAIRKTREALETIQARNPQPAGGFKFIGHQANFMVLKSVTESCGIATDNHWHNVVDFGNTGCASAPGVLSQRWEDIKSNDRIAMVVVGAGLTWAGGILNAVPPGRKVTLH